MSLSQFNSIDMYRIILSFIPSKSYFQQIKLSNFKDAPIQNKQVFLFEGETWSSKLLLNLTTDSDGLASFSLNTSSLPEKDINLMVWSLYLPSFLLCSLKGSVTWVILVSLLFRQVCIQGFIIKVTKHLTSLWIEKQFSFSSLPLHTPQH